MTREQHEKLLELRRILFNEWVNDPTNKEKEMKLEMLNKILFS